MPPRLRPGDATIDASAAPLEPELASEPISCGLDAVDQQVLHQLFAQARDQRQHGVRWHGQAEHDQRGDQRRCACGCLLRHRAPPCPLAAILRRAGSRHNARSRAHPTNRWRPSIR